MNLMVIFVQFKKCWHQFKKIVLGKHENNIVEYKKLVITDFDKFEDIKNKIKFLIKNKEKVIFLVGYFGTGKTYIINNVIDSYKKEGKLIFKKEFLNINSTVAAYYNLLGYFKVFLFLFFIYLFFYRFNLFYSYFLLPVTIFLCYVLIFNKFRFTYALYSFFSCCVDYLILSKFRIFELIKKILEMRNVHDFIHRTYVIDDVSRSNLNKNEIYFFLKNLWKLNRTYVVVFGFSKETNSSVLSKNEIIDLCNSLNGKLIFVSSFYKLNEKILNNYLSLNFNILESPFKNPTWLNLFTPSDILSIINNFSFKIEFLKKSKKEFFICDLFINFLILRMFFEKLIYKLNLNVSINLLISLCKNKDNVEVIDFYKSILDFLIKNIFSKRLQISKFCIFNNYGYRVKSSSDLFEIVFSESEEEFLSFLMLTSQIWINHNGKESFSETNRRLSC